MNSNAPGQLLGYSIQFPRALCHLLKSGPGDVVCIEVLGDVATLKSNSMVIVEEDKSSIVSNPLTDRSTDLWKTFSNWIKAINDKELDLGKAKFQLYTNKTGETSIVNAFSSAKNKEEAEQALDTAKTKLSDITEKHEIWKYYDYAVNKNESLLLDVIERFELEFFKSTGFEEVLSEIRLKIVPENQLVFLAEKLSGWLLKYITEKIAANQPAMVKWEEFNSCFIVLFERTRRLELIDFTFENPPKDSSIEQALKIRPCYLKQLECIKVTDEELIEAVYDFMKAEINRQEWIKKEIINEDIASDFETKLERYWKNQKKRIGLTNDKLGDCEKGQLLYSDCKSRQETIRDMTPPVTTISGTYHALANKPTIGWHPSWESLFLNQKEK